MKRFAYWGMAFSALVVAAMFPGCLTAAKTVAAAYDAQSDQFRFLTVYQWIMSDKPQNEATDEKWLSAVYENRQHLIIAPQDSIFDSWGESAVLRLATDRWVDLPLSAVPSDGLKSHSSPIPLADITVVPGRFFLRGPDNLCYYHEVLVPGKTADACLANINQRLSTNGKNTPAEWLAATILRRQLQPAPISWDDFTKSAIDRAVASLDSTQQPATQPTTPSSLSIPFDVDSLIMLRNDLLAGKLPLTRHADQVSVIAHLTDSDVAGVVNFSNSFRAGLDDPLIQAPVSDKPDVENMRRKLANMMNSVTVTAPDNSHVEVTVDLMSLFNSFDDPVDTSPPPDKGMHQGGSLMTAYATGNLDVDQTLTVEQVEQDFKNGTLKGYPPAQSVAPGTDLGEIHPATEP